MAADATELKQALLAEYGHFADQRIKRLDKGHLFIVDDRSPGDYGANRQLFSYFCLIWADVIGPDEVEVTLRGNVPAGASVSQWRKANGIKGTEAIVFRVTPNSLEKLTTLAAAFKAIVAGSYSVKSYKFTCPRTAKSLVRLHKALAKHWG